MVRFIDTWKKNMEKAWKYMLLYFKSSTFHGVQHIVDDGGNKHYSEIFFWLFIFIAFSFGAIITIFKSYNRYIANPTVITLDKNYKSWNITFPATTFCFVDKFDAVKAEKLVQKKWSVKNGKKFQYYMKFLKVLSNSSYYNLKQFHEFQNDHILLKENLTQLMYEVNFAIEKLSPTLFNGKITYFYKTLLEMGICYSVAGVLTAEFSPLGSYRKNEDKLIKTFKPEYCVYSRILCYGIVENFPRDITVYVHSPYEVPFAASPYHTLYVNHQMELVYSHYDIKASENIKKLYPDQRRCYFYDEMQKGLASFYSFNTCIMECRKSLAMKFCNCVPHFYVNRGENPVCNIKQLLCIYERSSELLSLFQIVNKTEKLCSCYQTCDDTNIVLDHEKTSKQQSFFLGESFAATRYKWAIEIYSKTRFKRDIIFGIEELLVSFGGTACFFLGGSLMSAIEFIYFFTFRFISQPTTTSNFIILFLNKIRLLSSFLIGVTEACSCVFGRWFEKNICKYVISLFLM